jgi:hypothetical protein
VQKLNEFGISIINYQAFLQITFLIYVEPIYHVEAAIQFEILCQNIELGAEIIPTLSRGNHTEKIAAYHRSV